MKKGSKVRIGEVINNKMSKTVVVKIKRRVSHFLYGKIMTREKKVKAHDVRDECKIGDIVQIRETRPLSKDKHWRVVKILNKEEKIQ